MKNEFENLDQFLKENNPDTPENKDPEAWEKAYLIAKAPVQKESKLFNFIGLAACFALVIGLSIQFNTNNNPVPNQELADLEIEVLEDEVFESEGSIFTEDWISYSNL